MGEVIACEDELLGCEHAFFDENRLLKVRHDALRQVGPPLVEGLLKANHYFIIYMICLKGFWGFGAL